MNGIVGASGDEPETVDLAGVPALYVDGSPRAFVKVDQDFLMAVFGVDRRTMHTIATVLFSAGHLLDGEELPR